MVSKLRVIELCAGAGGQALGLELAGFDHELAIELDTNAVNTLRHNRPEWEVRQGDVADLNVWSPSDYAATGASSPIDLLAGGVPCPPFSMAGKQLGASDERDLFAWSVEQAAVMQPRAVMLENVRGLSMPRFAGYRQHVLDRFRDLGYTAEWRLLQASDFGVAQLRPRFVLVAMRPDDFAHFHWPLPREGKATVASTLLPLMAERGWRGVREWAEKSNDIAPTIVGGSKKHGGADLGPTRAKRAWAALGVDARGVADNPPGIDDKFSIGPKLTNEMVARIQGWDDAEFVWQFTGKKTSVYRQIGNAFPPPVAKAVGVQIAAALRRTSSRRRQETLADIDSIYLALRAEDRFFTPAELAQAASPLMSHIEIDRRIDVLSRDFEIVKMGQGSEAAYKLGAFKGFVGQIDHVRHEFYRSNSSKIS